MYLSFPPSLHHPILPHPIPTLPPSPPLWVSPFLGPPETMREHVVAAANAMKCGDWKKCRDYILDIKVIVYEYILVVALGSYSREG